MEIARQLEHTSYVEWGVALHRAQQDSGKDRLAEGYRIALEAATLLAAERDVWSRNNLACSLQEVSDAYFFVSVACLRATRPACAVAALQKSILRYPRRSMNPSWLGNLGNAYADLGDASKQRDYSERALRILEAHYGPDLPEVAKTVMNLGNAYGDLGDASKMRDYLERALRITEAHYGPDHPEVAKTLVNLGTASGALGDASKMRDYLERALRILEAHYGPDHPEVATTVTNLGNAYGALGDAFKK
eukprot:3223130-Amphidinium_carterae.1